MNLRGVSFTVVVCYVNTAHSSMCKSQLSYIVQKIFHIYLTTEFGLEIMSYKTGI